MAQKGKINLKSKKRPLALRRRQKRIIIVLVSFVLLFSGVYGLSRISFSPNVSISAVHVRGANIVPADALRKIVENQTAKPFWKLFSKNNILLAPQANIEKDISNSFKTIESVDVSFDSLHDLVVSVEERSPVALWCDSSENDPASKKCFFVDKTGYIFAEAPLFEGNVYLVWYGFIEKENRESENGETAEKINPIGERLMPEDSFKNLNEFIENVSRIGLKTVSVLEISENELEFHLSQGGVIIINRKLGYNQTLENLQSIVSAKQVELRGEFLKKVETIDVRFTGKAFVKLKD